MFVRQNISSTIEDKDQLATQIRAAAKREDNLAVRMRLPRKGLLSDIARFFGFHPTKRSYLSDPESATAEDLQEAFKVTLVHHDEDGHALDVASTSYEAKAPEDTQALETPDLTENFEAQVEIDPDDSPEDFDLPEAWVRPAHNPAYTARL